MSRKTMMNEKIEILPKNVSDKIAAGEVVTAPIAVIKELIENSIDAGADKISIKIEEGGKKLLSVQDNGCGILPSDIELVCIPHATSKISNIDDFDKISTLGFRGEALASIAAVSRVEIRTKTSRESTGTILRVEGGEFSKPKPTGAADGTTIIVEDLFYNTPARLKFLKSDRAETTSIVQFVSKMAIAYPEIRFSLQNGDTIVFATRGDGNLKNTINTVYGIPENDLIRVEKQGFYVYLHGYISPPDVTRKTRNGQIYFVNGRLIESEVFIKSVNDAFDGRLESGRHPLVYLFLDIKPYRLDVNVHPTKSRVRFYDPKNVGSFIKDAMLEALGRRESIPVSRTLSQMKQQKRKENKFFSLKDNNNNNNNQNEKNGEVESNSRSNNNSKSDKNSGSYNNNTLYSDKTKNDEPVDHINIKTLLSPIEYSENELSESSGGKKVNDSVNMELDDMYNIAEGNNNFQQLSFKIDSLNVLGSVFSTYLLATDEDGLFLIDQHAAHERINYEKLMAQRNNRELLTQELLTPHLIEMSAEAKQTMDLWADWLSTLGFITEVFGDQTLIVKAFPAFISFDEGATFLSDIIETADSEPPENMREIERIISKACKNSIKGNQKIDDKEIKALLKELARCDNPYNCPHGRPVLIQLSKTDLEQMFKR